jgi:hypothetical protein
MTRAAQRLARIRAHLERAVEILKAIPGDVDDDVLLDYLISVRFYTQTTDASLLGLVAELEHRLAEREP